MGQFFMKNISTIARCATLYRDAQLAKVGLNGYQAPYIPEICGAPGITQEQIAQRLHVNKSSVTRQLALLEENGFIIRQRSTDDKRAVKVYPIEKMQQALPVVRDTFLRWRLALTEGLTEQELELLEALLEKLAYRAQVIR